MAWKLLSKPPTRSKPGIDELGEREMKGMNGRQSKQARTASRALGECPSMLPVYPDVARSGPYRWMTVVWTLSLLAVLAFSSGCGGGGLIAADMRDGLDEIREMTPAATEGSVAVNIMVPQVPGITGSVDGYSYFTQDSPEAAEAYIEQQFASRTATIAVYYDNFWLAVQRAFEARLGERYSQVTVTINQPTNPNVIQVNFVNLTQQMCSQHPDEQCVSAHFQVAGQSQMTLDGEGYGRQSNAHIAWIFPSILLGFPISLAIVFPVLSGLTRDVAAGVMCRALDNAALQFAQSM